MRQIIETIEHQAGSLRIAVIGDVMVDENVEGHVSRISPEAPVPILAHHQSRILPGGAANVAAGILALGANCKVIGVVGNDRNADALEDALRKKARGDVTFGLVRDAERPTTTKTRLWGASQGARQQLFRIDRESSAQLDGHVLSIVLEHIRGLVPGQGTSGFDLIVVSDYEKGVVCEEVVRAAVATGIPVIVAPRHTTRKMLFQGARIILPNESEAKSLAKSYGYEGSDVVDVARVLQQNLAVGNALPQIVITRGKNGIMGLKESGQTFSYPSHTGDVFDVTGAGDTVLAVLATCIAAGTRLEDAGYLANAAAGIKVQKTGVATVTFDELKEKIGS